MTPLSKRIWFLISIVSVAIVINLLFFGNPLHDDKRREAPLFAAQFGTRHIDLNDEVGKKIILVNFWATWCAPCREEIPLLVAAQQQCVKRMLQIVGIGIDRADKISEFAAQLKITYTLLVADSNVIDTMRQLGNRSGGLPFTVVLDRRGAVAKTRLGALKPGELDQILVPLLD